MRHFQSGRPHCIRVKRPTAIDLFSGCGGLTLGLKQAGFHVIGAVEIDALAVETYRSNHRRTKVWHTDIRKLKGFQIRKQLGLRRGELDLLAGCPPCQGFSSMRTLNGNRKIEDERNDLVFDYLRLVKELLPKAVMMENVPGLATDPRMIRILAVLKGLGYYIKDDSVRVLGVGKYGVPQLRRRMLLLTGRFGVVSFAPDTATVPTVREWIGDLPKAGNSGDPLHDLPERRNERVMSFIKSVPRAKTV
jgi:DNA (cytosine-5)-methyltransferase 1